MTWLILCQLSLLDCDLSGRPYSTGDSVAVFVGLIVIIGILVWLAVERAREDKDVPMGN